MKPFLALGNAGPNLLFLKKSHWVFLFCLLFVFLNAPLFAANPQDNSATFIQYLSQEKNRLQLNIEQLKLQKPPTSELDFIETRKNLNSELLLNQARMDSLNAFSDNQLKQQLDFTQKLKHLQQLPLGSTDPKVLARVERYTLLISNSKATFDLIKDNLSEAQTFQELIKHNLQVLDQWNINFQLEKHLETIKNNKIALNQELDSLYTNSHAAIKTSKDATPIDIEAKTLINNQYIAFVQNASNALDIQKNVVKANQLVLKNIDSKTLQQVIEVYDDAITQGNKLNESTELIKSRLKAIELLNGSTQFKESVKTLDQRISEQLKTFKDVLKGWSERLVEYRNQYKKFTSTHQSLAEYRTNSWLNIIKKIIAIPSLFYKSAKGLTLKVYDSFRWLDNLHALLVVAILFMLMIFFITLNQFLKSLSAKNRSSLTGYLFDGMLALIKRNIPMLCIFFMLLAVFYYTNISFANYELFFNLFLIWLVFRVLILIARLSLLERISDYSGEDVKLYYRIKWLLLFGGWTAALMAFSHLYPLSILLQDIFNRLFMLFILTLSWVAWKSRVLILDLLNPLLKLKKRYIKNALSLLVILIPVTLFTTAVIGLSGFFNLAWSMSRYQGFILMLLVAYILIRGLLVDAMEFLSESMISNMENGWLWIEVFLKPLDKILRLALILISIWVLFELFGLFSDSLVMLNIKKIAQYSIVHITGIHITILSLVKFIVLVALLCWIAKWTREFCYRSLYANTTDAGIKNSLSVFTQYAVILLGSIITLHVLGFDLSGMSMVLGGLAVGMGFGLKDFANNIVGGIMLLIERPVREGDLISLGEYEGQVAHIGIRSMRVSTWDNTEVLIPNAETFNKPFINWTHQDGIVRTVVPIKVSRADDPVIIQQLILDVLAIIPEIVSFPAPEVYLKKIDEALIEFEVRYFINVHEHTRYAVRSKVLFAITAQFKAAGIRHPIDPIALEFKEGHGDFFTPKDKSKDNI